MINESICIIYIFNIIFFKFIFSRSIRRCFYLCSVSFFLCCTFHNEEKRNRKIYKIILSAILFDMNFVIGEQKFAAANDFCIFWYQEFDTNFPTCQSQGHTLISLLLLFLFFWCSLSRI